MGAWGVCRAGVSTKDIRQLPLIGRSAVVGPREIVRNLQRGGGLADLPRAQQDVHELGDVASARAGQRRASGRMG